MPEAAPLRREVQMMTSFPSPTAELANFARWRSRIFVATSRELCLLTTDAGMTWSTSFGTSWTIVPARNIA